MGQKTEVMVLDDEPTVGERLKDYLEKKDMVVETFTDSQTAIERLAEKRFDVVITDLKMSGPTGLDVLVFVKDEHLPTQVIIITGYATMEAARGAETVGAMDFITKPFQMKDMYKLVLKAAKKARR
jgi:DNA-binding NtrC family response regulator